MRYMARRIVSGEWITRDLPLSEVESMKALNGPGSLVGNLEPEANRALWNDRLRLADDWATMIYAVNDSGEIDNAGIVLPPTQYDAAARITCAGVAAYPAGYIYNGSRLWGPQAKVETKRNSKGTVVVQGKPEIRRPDPIRIFRDHWEWIQSQPSSDLGVRIVGDLSTGVRANGDPGVAIGNYAEPYRLRKWETPDLGSEIDNLAQVTPFDFAERFRWKTDGSGDPDHIIEVGYPRLGTRREELRFALGENIVITPAVQTLDQAANMLIGIGNGEAGPSMVYDELPWFDGRLRRHRVLTDKSASKALLQRRMRIVQGVLQQRYEVTSVAIIDHPNARLSDIRLGDDIRVQAEHPEYGLIDVWCRVLSMTRGDSDEGAVLTTSNSAFFLYRPSEEIT